MTEVKCPKCSHEFAIQALAQAIKEQSLWLQLDYKGDLLSAETVWGLVKEFEGLMKASAKDLGTKATTYVRNIVNKNKRLRIEFVVMCDVPDLPKFVMAQLDAINSMGDKQGTLLDG